MQNNSESKKGNGIIGSILIFTMFYWIALLSRIKILFKARKILKGADDYRVECSWINVYALRLLLVSSLLIVVNLIPLGVGFYYYKNDIKIKYGNTPLMILMKKQVYNEVLKKRGSVLGMSVLFSVALNVIVLSMDEVRKGTEKLKRAAKDVGVNSTNKDAQVLWTPAFVYFDTYGMDKKSLAKNDILWQAANIRINPEKIKEDDDDPRHTLLFQGVPLKKKYDFDKRA